VAAVVCTAALATGGAVEVNHKIQERTPAPAPANTAETHSVATAPAAAPVLTRSGGKPQLVALAPSRPAKATPAAKPEHKTATAERKKVAGAAPIALQDDPAAISDDPQADTGGVRAPDAPAAPTAIPTASPAPVVPTTDQAQPTPAPATAGSEQPAAPPAAAGGQEAPAPTGAPPPPAGG
jgi:hypothetical protein